jgi:hypothetical protein
METRLNVLIFWLDGSLHKEVVTVKVLESTVGVAADASGLAPVTPGMTGVCSRRHRCNCATCGRIRVWPQIARGWSLVNQKMS